MWIALFSQTGSEILNVSRKLGIKPDLIITNKTDLKDVSGDFIKELFDRVVFIPNKPLPSDYLKILPPGDHIITLHGYLRIIPPEICSKYTIFNLHPGLITEYPELKGFNPQEKAYNLHLPYTGAVIHKVTPVLDSGEILDSFKINIEGLSLDDVYNKLHNLSTDLWVRFLKRFQTSLFSTYNNECK